MRPPGHRRTRSKGQTESRGEIQSPDPWYRDHDAEQTGARVARHLKRRQKSPERSLSGDVSRYPEISPEREEKRFRRPAGSEGIHRPETSPGRQRPWEKEDELGPELRALQTEEQKKKSEEASEGDTFSFFLADRGDSPGVGRLGGRGPGGARSGSGSGSGGSRSSRSRAAASWGLPERPSPSTATPP